MEPIETLRTQYGWRVAGRWNEAQLQALLKSGAAINDYVQGLKGYLPGSWLARFLPAVFRQKGPFNRIRALRGNSFVFPFRDVWMQEGFENGPHPEWHIVHELGHVLDNRLGGWMPSTFSGGGPADEMVRAVGGKPEKGRLRFRPMRNYAAIITPLESWLQGGYGNTSVSEDFAETFSLTIFQPAQGPPRR
jgi:hypothetical protein